MKCTIRIMTYDNSVVVAFIYFTHSDSDPATSIPNERKIGSDLFSDQCFKKSHKAEVYPEPPQASNMESFAAIVNDFLLLAIIAKLAILEICSSPGCVFGRPLTTLLQTAIIFLRRHCEKCMKRFGNKVFWLSRHCWPRGGRCLSWVFFLLYFNYSSVNRLNASSQFHCKERVTFYTIQLTFFLSTDISCLFFVCGCCQTRCCLEPIRQCLFWMCDLQSFPFIDYVDRTPVKK